MPRLSKDAIREKHDDTFVEVLAQTNSPVTAIRAAEPALIDKPAYARLKAHRLKQRPDIKAKIDKKLEQNAKLALKQLPKLITSDNEQIATANVWKTIEHNIGTPVKRNLNVNATTTIEDVLFDS